MTRYDTRAQQQERSSRRRLNLVAGILLLGFAVYVLASYAYLTTTARPPTNTFSVVLGIFLLLLSMLPFSQAFIRRPHPESLEVRDDGLVLRFPGGKMDRRAWEDRPVEFAYDSRRVPRSKRPAEGMEVVLFLPQEGRHPGTTAFRPLELEVSGDAFEEVKKAMQKAGFRVVARRWSRRRPGDLVEFLRKGEQEGALPPEPRGGMSRLDRGRWESPAVSEEP